MCTPGLLRLTVCSLFVVLVGCASMDRDSRGGEHSPAADIRLPLEQRPLIWAHRYPASVRRPSDEGPLLAIWRDGSAVVSADEHLAKWLYGRLSASEIAIVQQYINSIRTDPLGGPMHLEASSVHVGVAEPLMIVVYSPPTNLGATRLHQLMVYVRARSRNWRSRDKPWWPVPPDWWWDAVPPQ